MRMSAARLLLPIGAALFDYNYTVTDRCTAPWAVK